MKFLIVSFIALGVWQCAVAAPQGEDVQEMAPVGDCPPVDGESPVLLPDSMNKSIFYICSHGKPIATPCPNGLEFDDELKTCTFAKNYSPVGECPPEDGRYPTYLPDSENATIYYECSNGVPILMLCPPGLEFDPELKGCNWPAVTDQPKGQCPETDAGVVTLLSDEEDCAKYYVCFAGKPFMATCPEGLLFNPEKNYCDFPENVKCHEDKDDDDEEQ